MEQLKLGDIHNLDIIDTSGAVMNAIGVLESAPAAYIKLPKPQKGGGSFWDFSATAAIFEALKQQDLPVVVSNIHGAPLDLNCQDSYYMNHDSVVYTFLVSFSILGLDYTMIIE
ncbi:hypothetical protein [Photobacterium swingsii]|uniref:hypothetical protein n=1 Tax=Photobacterium swingsii TaxID=680026 RepID=UPI0040694ADA